MAIETCLTVAGKLAFLEGKVKSDHVFKLALYTEKASLGSDTEVYSRVNEVVADGYEPATLAKPVFSKSGKNAVMDFPGDVKWKNVTIAAAGCVIYDESLDNLVIAVGSFDGTITSTNDSFTLTPAKGLIKFL